MLDSEMQAFVEKVDSLYPPDAVDLDADGQRRVYDDLCGAFSPAHPKGVRALDDTLARPGGTIPVRRYHREGGEGPASVVYFHGGGFVVGGLASHDSVCAEICGTTGHRVVSVDYRLAPEHVHPAHFEDALLSYRAIAAEGRPVVLAGDSAGGNLAAAVALAVRGSGPQPAGQVLIYPGLGGEALGLASYAEHAEAIHLTVKDVLYYKAVRAGGPPPEDDPTFAPLAAGDYAGTAPCVAVSADIDPLRDDSRAYVERLGAAGVQAVWINEPGLVHGYIRARHMSGKARASFRRITEAIDRLGRGQPIA
ncbi:MAG: alpha/beta hydrolase [Hyphomicrobiaceae bacterium]